METYATNGSLLNDNQQASRAHTGPAANTVPTSKAALTIYINPPPFFKTLLQAIHFVKFVQTNLRQLIPVIVYTMWRGALSFGKYSLFTSQLHASRLSCDRRLGYESPYVITSSIVISLRLLPTSCGSLLSIYTLR